MTIYFIAYAVIAASVAVGTFTYVERRRHADSPRTLTVAVLSVVLGALWPALPLGVAQTTLIAWWAASLRRHDEGSGHPRVISFVSRAGTSSPSSTLPCYRS
jgi:hypothetical protein